MNECRERLEGVKEEVGLSQEALLQEHEAALQLQLQARWHFCTCYWCLQEPHRHSVCTNSLCSAAHALTSGHHWQFAWAAMQTMHLDEHTVCTFQAQQHVTASAIIIADTDCLWHQWHVAWAGHLHAEHCGSSMLPSAKVCRAQHAQQVGLLLCREDIESADQAVAAMANMLHQLAPDNKFTRATRALQQVGALVHHKCLVSN